MVSIIKTIQVCNITLLVEAVWKLPAKILQLDCHSANAPGQSYLSWLPMKLKLCYARRRELVAMCANAVRLLEV